MTKRSAATTVALSVFGVLLAGCVVPGADGDPEAASSPSTSTSTSEPAPDPSRTSLEGRFDRDTMDQYVDAVLPMIEDWMHDTWPQISLPKVVYVEAGESGHEGCLDSDGRNASFDSRSYEYCPPDVTVYVGQNTLWEFYSETGDAGPAVGLAHEFGHHVQSWLGLPAPRTPQQSIAYENQADCLAGAWTKYTDEHQWLEYPDDIEDIESLFPIIGSAEGADRDHGTAAEREDAFTEGFQGGVTACGVPAG
jgi:predicted metalloprotease